MQTDPVGPVDIEAYLDGELDLHRRLVVEDYLAREPEQAARVMNDFRARTALRLLQSVREDSPASLDAAAGRLSQRLRGEPKSWRRLPALGKIGGGVAALALVVAVALPPAAVQAEPPAYIADAVMAYQTGLLRAAMRSQPETTLLDADEIQRAMRIRVPHLPDGWQITDVQIFPSDEGPALQIMIRTADTQHISIFAVRSPSAAPTSPVAVRHGETSVAYWRKDDISYALTGMDAPEALDLAAEDLADERIS